MATKMINKTNQSASAMGLGFFDKKNREIGMKVVVFECDFVENDQGRWSVAPGHYFAAVAQTARNGEAFGAVQPTKFFTSREERDVYLAKKWADALKSASKKS